MKLIKDYGVDKTPLSFSDVDSKAWVVKAREFEVLVGNSSRNILLKDTFNPFELYCVFNTI